MDLDKLKDLFKNREAQNIAGWEDILFLLQKSNSNDYFMLVIGKGSDNERRSRFLTYSEVLEIISKKITR